MNTTNGHKTFSIEKSINNLGIKKEDAIPILKDYLASDEQMDILKKAIEENNFGNIYSSAHSLKSVALSFLIYEIIEICIEIENLAENKTSANYQKLYEDLKKQMIAIYKMI